MDVNSWQQALGAVWTSSMGQALAFLPNMLGAIVVFVLGIILGSWAKTLLVKGLQMLKLESMIKDTRFKEFLVKAEVTEKLEDVIGSIVQWIIVLTFFVTATNLIGLTAVASVLAGILQYIPNVVSAVIVLALGVLLAGLVEGFVKGALASIDLKTGRLMGKIASYTVVTIAVLAAFSELKIAESFINILFIGFVAMLALGFGLALGLGAKDLVKEILGDWYQDLKKELAAKK